MKRFCLLMLALVMTCSCVPANAVKRQSAATPTPMITVSPSPAAVPIDGYGRVTKDNTELRMNPEGNAPVRYILSQGEIAKMIEFVSDGQGAWWVHVDYEDGMLGYILSGSIQEMKPNEVKEYLDSLKATPPSSPTPTPSPTPEKTTVEIGDIVTFGRYPQTSDGKEEPIEWLVLDVKGDEALLLSRYGLDAKAYNTEYISITWEKCTLRTWLNGTFLNKAFTDKEQTGIELTNVDNSSSQGYSNWSTSGGNNTQDKVFLLSYAEANEYLGLTYDNSNTKSWVAPTAYAIKQGAYTNRDNETEEGKAAGWWWLRSPGHNQDCAALVSPDGSLYGIGVNCDDAVVRPALWINLESEIF